MKRGSYIMEEKERETRREERGWKHVGAKGRGEGGEKTILYIYREK